MSLRALAIAVCVVAAVGVNVRVARAIPPFWKEFEAKYVKPDSADEKEKAFAAAAENAKTGKCNVCHMGSDKKMRNAYGKQVAMLLKKDNFKPERLKDDGDKAKAEIAAALEAVAALKSGDDKSPTFGELIAQGKLPGGEAAPAESAKPAEPSPAPAPAPAATASTPPSAAAQEAIGKIQKLGGTVQVLAMNDDSLVVDFHLGGTQLNDEGLALIKELPKVVQLDLKDTQITDAGLANLEPLATLNRLHLEKTKITDAGLAHLKGLANLEYLNLYGTAVTDAGLEHLKELKNLKKLYVWQTQVTDEGIAKLKEALPGVSVVK